MGQLFFFFVRVFLTSELSQKARVARASDVIGQLVWISLATRIVIVQNGRAWSRVTRHPTPLELAEIGRRNGVMGDYS